MKIFRDLFISKSIFSDQENHNLQIGTREWITVLSFSGITSLKEEYKKISENPAYPEFCIHFDSDGNEEQLSWLIRFTMLSAYRKRDGVLTVFAKMDLHPFIRETFSRQGFNTIELIDFDNSKKIKIDTCSGYIICREEALFYDMIITEIENSDLTLKTINECWLVKEIIAPDQFPLKKIISENNSLKKQVSELMTELKNKEEYLQIALKQKETEYILNFYHQEYEVLPLWYKRFGHLIKIITGKRKLIK